MSAGEVEQTENQVLAEEEEISPGETPEDLAQAGAKYGNIKGPPGVSGFLQKRLQKGQKFFDSGDYNVARSMKKGPVGGGAPGGLANPGTKRNLPLLLPPTAQDAPMPVLTPEDLPHHSHPHEQSKLCNQVNPTH